MNKPKDAIDRVKRQPVDSKLSDVNGAVISQPSEDLNSSDMACGSTVSRSIYNRRIRVMEFTGVHPPPVLPLSLVTYCIILIS